MFVAIRTNNECDVTNNCSQRIIVLIIIITSVRRPPQSGGLRLDIRREGKKRRERYGCKVDCQGREAES